MSFSHSSERQPLGFCSVKSDCRNSKHKQNKVSLLLFPFCRDCNPIITPQNKITKIINTPTTHIKETCS